VQGWSRKKKEALIQGNTIELKKLAECQNESHFRNAPFGFAQGANIGSAQETGEKGKNLPVVERSREDTPESKGETYSVVERSREVTPESKGKTYPVVERSQEVTPDSKRKILTVVERSRNDQNQKVHKDG